MKRRALIKGLLIGGGVAAAPSLSLAATSYEFNQRVPGIKPVIQMGGGSDPVMQDASPQDRTGIPSTGEVLAQDGGVEWYGEVSTSELITGNALAAAFGFDRGQSINNTSPWLHVRLDGRELFIAKRPYRDTLFWTDIHAYSLITGNRFIDINGQRYLVRLLKGASVSDIPDVNGHDIEPTHGSEWNRIMYRLVSAQASNTASEAPFVQLAQYSQSDVQVREGPGGYTWCQETTIGGWPIARGALSLGFLQRNGPSGSGSYFGWRPVLEKA